MQLASRRAALLALASALASCPPLCEFAAVALNPSGPWGNDASAALTPPAGAPPPHTQQLTEPPTCTGPPDCLCCGEAEAAPSAASAKDAAATEPDASFAGPLDPDSGASRSATEASVAPRKQLNPRSSGNETAASEGPSDPAVKFDVWNPVDPSEPSEAEQLKHKGLPEDFVLIPMLDKMAEAGGEEGAPPAGSPPAAPKGGPLAAPEGSLAALERMVNEETSAPWTSRRSLSRDFKSTRRPSRFPTTGSRLRSASVSRSGLPRRSLSLSRASLAAENEAADPNTRTWGLSTPAPSSSPPAAAKEEEVVEETPAQKECKLEVAGVKIDATFVDAECTGSINLLYSPKTDTFSKRKLLLTNTNSSTVTVVLRTMNAKITGLDEDDEDEGTWDKPVSPLEKPQTPQEPQNPQKPATNPDSSLPTKTELRALAVAAEAAAEQPVAQTTPGGLSRSPKGRRSMQTEGKSGGDAETAAEPSDGALDEPSKETTLNEPHDEPQHVGAGGAPTQGRASSSPPHSGDEETSSGGAAVGAFPEETTSKAEGLDKSQTSLAEAASKRTPESRKGKKGSRTTQQEPPPTSFLGEDLGEEEEVKEKHVADMLRQMRRHCRKEPQVPLDLVISYSSPLDSAKPYEGATSFMQTAEGSQHIEETCKGLSLLLQDDTGYLCEIIEPIDMVILQFPPTADLKAGGEIEQLLKKLLTLEGRRIVFWELSTPTSLQMVPVDTDLPEPPKTFFEKPVLLQAKAELKQQCSSQVKTHARLLGDGGFEQSPVAPKVPSDPAVEEKLWGLYAAKCVHAWMHGEQGHKSVVVAVVDSGVEEHEDLNENAWTNPEEILDGKDNDNNGFVDDLHGWNFSLNARGIEDKNGHGTHVAGTIGGVPNGMGIVGCSPNVSLMKVQQFGESGKGSVADAVRGVAYALLNGASIVNNSWGAPVSTASLQLVIQRAQHMRNGLGVLIVNAAGNEGSNNDIRPFYPAGHDYKHTFSVGAYNADGNLAYFSNYGQNSVTLLAPGDKIFSTFRDGSYEFLSGTSMAAPHVSGIAALVFGVFAKANSEVTASEVKDIIMTTLQPLEAAVGITQSEGAPDALAAVLMARMGGMWCQMKCTDMVIELQQEEAYASTLLVRGYEEAKYSADIQVEVYDKSGNLLGYRRIPFKLTSTRAPAANKPTDEEAADAFSQYTKELEQSSPLCDVQAKYMGMKDSGWSVLKIVAVVLGSVAALLAIILLSCLIYCRLHKRAPPASKKSDAGSHEIEKESFIPLTVEEMREKESGWN